MFFLKYFNDNGGCHEQNTIADFSELDVQGL